jgi:hypothetical protein
MQRTILSLEEAQYLCLSIRTILSTKSLIDTQNHDISKLTADVITSSIMARWLPRLHHKFSSMLHKEI